MLAPTQVSGEFLFILRRRPLVGSLVSLVAIVDDHDVVFRFLTHHDNVDRAIHGKRDENIAPANDLKPILLRKPAEPPILRPGAVALPVVQGVPASFLHSILSCEIRWASQGGGGLVEETASFCGVLRVSRVSGSSRSRARCLSRRRGARLSRG